MCSLHLTHPSAHTWSSGHTHTHTPGAVDTHTHTHTPEQWTHTHTHTHTWSSGHTHTHTPGAVDTHTHTHLEQWTHTHTHTPGAVDTHTHTHTRRSGHTHTHTWSSGQPGEQSGVRCLAQGSHLSRGQLLPEPRFEPTTSVTSATLYPLGHDCPTSGILLVYTLYSKFFKRYFLSEKQTLSFKITFPIAHFFKFDVKADDTHFETSLVLTSDVNCE